MKTEWSSCVTAFDASPFGLGVVEKDVPAEHVEQVGALSERARFRGPLSVARGARRAALESELFSLDDVDLIARSNKDGFQEVPTSLLEGS